ncbi:MAG: S41 family peptidase [Sphingobacterium composti]
MKRIATIILTIILLNFNFETRAQNCDCLKNFEWVKKTFEENDAGFEYAVSRKGIPAYQTHNQKILEKVKSAKTLSECGPILYEWLTFFRSGHIAIQLNSPQLSNQNISIQSNTKINAISEKYSTNIDVFTNVLSEKGIADFEGIWWTDPYKIGVKKVNWQYIGFIIESSLETWAKGDIKFKIDIEKDKYKSIFYLRDRTPVESQSVILIGNNHLKIGDIVLTRLYPTFEVDPYYEQYFKSQKSSIPYIERLNNKTLYFRIPSFNYSEKTKIDSVITANKSIILSTENLIIDITNGTGGSDRSYSEIIPFLYTNPIRNVGVEYLSTPLNNQRMIEFITNPAYNIAEEEKVHIKKAYDTLENNHGKFVNLQDSVVFYTKQDTVYEFPKNIGIIINQNNGSTDEQFLLAAKQSKKVKLFGTTTFGVLDISNMYFIDSPCKEFKLGYCLTRSMRIPDFEIDNKGIQPDYYIDKSIHTYEWIKYVNDILN